MNRFYRFCTILSGKYDPAGGGAVAFKDHLKSVSPKVRYRTYISFGRNITLFLLLTFFSNTAAAASAPTYTFWYAANPPVDLLSQFDRIIVEPDNINAGELTKLKQHGGRVLAYLSIGEWNPQRTIHAEIDPAWVLADNSHWKSQVMDLTADGWQQFLLNRSKALKQLGFDGLFLDTLDSHMLPKISPPQRKAQQQGLVKIVQQLKADQPDFLLVANRGFEVMDQIASHLDAVAAESLYRGWNNAKQQYLTVPENDRIWLKQTLLDIQTRHRLDIVILDYLPPAQRAEARRTAQRIEQDGFIPWIATPGFDYMGVGALEAVPRKILLLYDSRQEHQHFVEIDLHRFCAPIFEYLGYLPEYADVHQALPQEILKGRYSGIVVWLAAPPAKADLQLWLEQKIKETIPVALLGDLNVLDNPALLNLMGLRLGRQLDTSSLTMQAKSDLIGFETDQPGRIEDILPLTTIERQSNTSHLRMQDRAGRHADLVVTGDWGGFAAGPALLDEDFNYSSAWIIDPFAFFQKALHLPSLPAPNLTTENGRRLFFIHIDGDGFMEKFETIGRGYASQVLLEEIFNVYQLPHTISIIEGEVGPTGLYPEISSKLESIARKIFALNHVEIASHSYSHPFFWRKISDADASGKYNLPISDYAFDLEREILGSVQYIDTRLAPPGKKTRVFLWTGNCVPTPEAAEMASQAGLLNMNGGNTFIIKERPSISRALGIGLTLANGEFQTYAPISNENIYTNNWQGPYMGYRRAVETFQLTDAPRRLKPINIYYHFYSGSKYASLKALKTVYDWATAQEITPVYASDYILKALNFRNIGLARKSDGTWRVTGLDHLKSLRLSQTDGWPQIAENRGIIGARKLTDGIYLHAGPDSVAEFTLGPTPDASIYLGQANGRVLQWDPKAKDRIDFRIQAKVPVYMQVTNTAQKCRIKWRQGILQPSDRSDHASTFTFPVNDTGSAELICHE